MVTKNDLMALINTQAEWCVSLYMPMVRAGIEVQQNPIRFRNLLRKAEAQLEQLGLRPQETERLLQPATALLDDFDLWQQRADGLAVFVNPDSLRVFRLPIAPAEHAIVKTRFFVKPLLPLLSGDGTYYLLALSQDEVRLMRGTRDSMAEVELNNVPASLADALAIDQMRSYIRAATKGGGGTVWQSSGASADDEKKQILRYFQQIDRGLRELIADKQIPLLLAGVDYLLPIYREANTYPHLIEGDITGNPEMLSAKDLHQPAWERVKPLFARAEAEQRELFATLAGRADPRAVLGLKHALTAAHQGRVASLFVALDRQLWGQFDPETGTMHVHPEMQPGDQDLLDLLAAQTLANSGAVFAVEADSVPGGEAFAAILRY